MPHNFTKSEVEALIKRGFVKLGPMKDSDASAWQSEIGNVPKNHPFCDDQRRGILAPNIFEDVQIKKSLHTINDSARKLLEYFRQKLEVDELRKRGCGKLGLMKDCDASASQSEICNVPKSHPFCDDHRRGMLAPNLFEDVKVEKSLYTINKSDCKTLDYNRQKPVTNVNVPVQDSRSEILVKKSLHLNEPDYIKLDYNRQKPVTFVKAPVKDSISEILVKKNMNLNEPDYKKIDYNGQRPVTNVKVPLKDYSKEPQSISSSPLKILPYNHVKSRQDSTDDDDDESDSLRRIELKLMRHRLRMAQFYNTERRNSYSNCSPNRIYFNSDYSYVPQPGNHVEYDFSFLSKLFLFGIIIVAIAVWCFFWYQELERERLERERAELAEKFCMTFFMIAAFLFVFRKRIRMLYFWVKKQFSQLDNYKILHS